MKEKILKALLSTLPRRYMGKVAGEFVPIFMLHRMVNFENQPDQKSLDNLKQFLSYVRKEKYVPISLDSLFGYFSNGENLPNDSVCFTVDDGFNDQFELIAPIFSGYDIPLTCFVVSDFINGKLWPWDAQISYILSKISQSYLEVSLPNGEIFRREISNDSRRFVKRNLINRLKEIDQTNIYSWLPALYLSAEVDIPSEIPAAFQPGSWASLNKFQAQGHKVAAHSQSHRVLSRLNAEDSKQEILGSYSDLKKEIPSCSNIFAFPSGRACDFGEREEQFVSDSSMQGAVSAIPRRAQKEDSINAIPRYSLPSNSFDFIQYLSYVEAIKEKFRNG